MNRPVAAENGRCRLGRRHAFAGMAAICLAALFWLGARATTPRGSGPDSPAPAEDWTLVLLADTQGYTTGEAGSRVLEAMFGWIRDNRERERIGLVVHAGDLVQNNRPEQWRRIRAAFALLDGVLPYVVAVGNHDLGSGGSARDRSTLLNDHFRITDNPHNAAIFGGSFETGAIENAWYRIVLGGEEFLVYSLEFGPRAAVVDWAAGVAGRFPALPALLVTHEFIDMKSAVAAADGLPRRTTAASEGSGAWFRLGGGKDALCGADVWERLIAPHPGFEFVFCGHYFHREKDAAGRSVVTPGIAHAFRADARPAGRAVHQMLFNPQWLPGGGQGWLRLLRFSADRRTVRVETFSPWLEKQAGAAAAVRTDAAHRFLMHRAPTNNIRP